MINWTADAPVTFRQAAAADFERAEAFRQALLERGILMPPFVITEARMCLATSDDDIDLTVSAAEQAFKAVA
jgi:glutamate-1-semialdehyde aminotransferase